MRLLGIIFAACLMLAVLQAAISLFVVVGAIMLLWGVFARPHETFGLLAYLLIAGVVMAHPVAAIIGVCAVLACCALVSACSQQHL